MEKRELYKGLLCLIFICAALALYFFYPAFIEPSQDNPFYYMFARVHDLLLIAAVFMAIYYFVFEYKKWEAGKGMNFIFLVFLAFAIILFLALVYNAIYMTTQPLNIIWIIVNSSIFLLVLIFFFIVTYRKYLR